MDENAASAKISKESMKAGDKANVRKTVTSIVSRVTKISEAEITGEKLIRDDLGVDSMQAIESLALIEKELDIVIDPDKAFNVATVDDLFTLVDTSLHQPSRENAI